MALLEFVRRLSRPPVLVIGRERWPALFTHSALLELEEISGVDVLNGELNLFRPRARQLVDAAFVLLKHAGAPYSREETLAFCSGFAARQEMRGVLVEAWRASTPEPKPPVASSGKEPPGPQTWMGAWSIAHQALRLSTEEWLSFTPRMVYWLLEEYLEALRQREYMHARIEAAVVNFSTRSSEEGVDAGKLMLHPWTTPEAKEEGLTAEKVMAVFAGLRKAR